MRCPFYLTAAPDRGRVPVRHANSDRAEVSDKGPHFETRRQEELVSDVETVEGAHIDSAPGMPNNNNNCVASEWEATRCPPHPTHVHTDIPRSRLFLPV